MREHWKGLRGKRERRYQKRIYRRNSGDYSRKGYVEEIDGIIQKGDLW
jgi:hypothetical protein